MPAPVSSPAQSCSQLTAFQPQCVRAAASEQLDTDRRSDRGARKNEGLGARGQPMRSFPPTGQRTSLEGPRLRAAHALSRRLLCTCLSSGASFQCKNQGCRLPHRLTVEVPVLVVGQQEACGVPADLPRACTVVPAQNPLTSLVASCYQYRPCCCLWVLKHAGGEKGVSYTVCQRCPTCVPPIHIWPCVVLNACGLPSLSFVCPSLPALPPRVTPLPTPAPTLPPPPRSQGRFERSRKRSSIK